MGHEIQIKGKKDAEYLDLNKTFESIDKRIGNALDYNSSKIVMSSRIGSISSKLPVEAVIKEAEQQLSEIVNHSENNSDTLKMLKKRQI